MIVCGVDGIQDHLRASKTKYGQCGQYRQDDMAENPAMGRTINVSSFD
jgi:hypothetical protein